MQAAFSDEEPANAVLARAERMLRSIEGSNGNRELVTASEAGWKRLEEIEAFQASGRAILGLGTGLYELDRLTGGLIRGDQHLIAARPSMGKTALGVRVMDGVATSRYNEEPVQVFFSMEMARSQIMDRWLFGKARVDQMRLRANRLTREDYRALGEAQKAIDGYRVIVDQDCRRPSEMRGVLRKVVQRWGRVDVIYVDHILKAHPDQRTESRRLDVAAVSADFKEIAKEFDCAGVILCQLNRVSPGTGDKEPELHHLAECGNLEQDADMVIYPHRPAYYDKAADPREAKAGILKQRNGPSGVSFPLTWFGEFSWFDNAASEMPPPVSPKKAHDSRFDEYQSTLDETEWRDR
jgi:replicative DNA helicase